LVALLSGSQRQWRSVFVLWRVAIWIVQNGTSPSVQLTSLLLLMHFLQLQEVCEVRVGVAAAWLTEAAVPMAQTGESEREAAAKARGCGDELTAAGQTMGERAVD
jgi:hypothetical protein